MKKTTGLAALTLLLAIPSVNAEAMLPGAYTISIDSFGGCRIVKTETPTIDKSKIKPSKNHVLESTDEAWLSSQPKKETKRESFAIDGFEPRRKEKNIWDAPWSEDATLKGENTFDEGIPYKRALNDDSKLKLLDELASEKAAREDIQRKLDQATREIEKIKASIKDRSETSLARHANNTERHAAFSNDSDATPKWTRLSQKQDGAVNDLSKKYPPDIREVGINFKDGSDAKMGRAEAANLFEFIESSVDRKARKILITLQKPEVKADQILQRSRAEILKKALIDAGFEGKIFFRGSDKIADKNFVRIELIDNN